MDVFEIIRKYTSGYVSKVGDVGNDNLHTEYEAATTICFMCHSLL